MNDERKSKNFRDDCLMEKNGEQPNRHSIVNNERKSSSKASRSRFEIPFYVGQKQKWVSGVTKYTTCSDIIKSLIKNLLLDEKSNNHGKKVGDDLISDTLNDICEKLCIVEQWHGVERPLAASSLIFRVWNAWGLEKDQISFHMRPIHHVNSQHHSSVRSRRSIAYDSSLHMMKQQQKERSSGRTSDHSQQKPDRISDNSSQKTSTLPRRGLPNHRIEGNVAKSSSDGNSSQTTCSRIRRRRGSNASSSTNGNGRQLVVAKGNTVHPKAFKNYRSLERGINDDVDQVTKTTVSSSPLKMHSPIIPQFNHNSQSSNPIPLPQRRPVLGKSAIGSTTPLKNKKIVNNETIKTSEKGCSDTHKLMNIILSQGETICSQLKRLQRREDQIERMVCEVSDGVGLSYPPSSSSQLTTGKDYLLDTYLNDSAKSLSNRNDRKFVDERLEDDGEDDIRYDTSVGEEPRCLKDMISALSSLHNINEELEKAENDVILLSAQMSHHGLVIHDDLPTKKFSNKNNQILLESDISSSRTEALKLRTINTDLQGQIDANKCRLTTLRDSFNARQLVYDDLQSHFEDAEHQHVALERRLADNKTPLNEKSRKSRNTTTIKNIPTRLHQTLMDEDCYQLSNSKLYDEEKVVEKRPTVADSSPSTLLLQDLFIDNVKTTVSNTFIIGDDKVFGHENVFKAYYDWDADANKERDATHFPNQSPSVSEAGNNRRHSLAFSPNCMSIVGLPSSMHDFRSRISETSSPSNDSYDSIPGYTTNRGSGRGSMSSKISSSEDSSYASSCSQNIRYSSCSNGDSHIRHKQSSQQNSQQYSIHKPVVAMAVDDSEYSETVNSDKVSSQLKDSRCVGSVTRFGQQDVDSDTGMSSLHSTTSSLNDATFGCGVETNFLLPKSSSSLIILSSDNSTESGQSPKYILDTLV